MLTSVFRRFFAIVLYLIWTWGCEDLYSIKPGVKPTIVNDSNTCEEACRGPLPCLTKWANQTASKS
jgi:hypothetical protein